MARRRLSYDGVCPLNPRRLFSARHAIHGAHSMIRRSVFGVGFGAALAVGAALATSIAPAHAAGWLEKNFWLSGRRYDAVVPLGQGTAAGSKVASRHAQDEGRLWQQTLAPVDIHHGPLRGTHPW